MKVAAVVVTFNRKILLQECLEALLGQSRVVDVIYIIDNASTDGTRDMLADLGFLTHSQIRYVLLAKNLGGAGGFHAGMKIATDEGSDWIWVMDDDGIPSPDVLATLVSYTKFPDVVAVAGRMVRKIEDLGTENYCHYQRVLLNNNKSHPYAKLLMTSFVGPLISTNAVKSIGLPRAEFFIHYDDFEYCVRLRSIGDIAWAPGPAMLHKEAARTWISRSFLGVTLMRVPVEKYAYLYYSHRNTTWTMTHTRQDRFIALKELTLFFLMESLKIVFWDRNKIRFRFHVLLKSLLDGLCSNFDNDFPSRLNNRQ